MSLRIILIDTSHPGNIGAVARAMKNMGFSDLTLVNPKYFPHEDATARASGAEDILENALITNTLEEAIVDCHLIIGASARERSIEWPILSPKECSDKIVRNFSEDNVAIVMGPEKNGLNNAQMDLCHFLLRIPTNPVYSSLNIAMAVQIICYEMRLAMIKLPEVKDSPMNLATGREMEYFYHHLEKTLKDIGFLNPNDPRNLMRRLRRLFNRIHLDHNEINILRGILSTVSKKIDKNDE